MAAGLLANFLLNASVEIAPDDGVPGHKVNEAKAALRELGEATEQKISAHLDIPRSAITDRNKVSSRLRDLREALIIEECGEEEGLKLYRPTGRTGARDVQTKMARAVRLKGMQNRALTRKDLAALAGCTQEYAARYLKFLKDRGYLLAGEAVKLSRYGLGLAYRVVPGKEKEEPPHWSRRAQEAKEREAGRDARATAQGPEPIEAMEKVRGYLGEMEDTLAQCAARLEQSQETLKQARIYLAPAPQEAKDGSEDNHQC